MGVQLLGAGPQTGVQACLQTPEISKTRPRVAAEEFVNRGSVQSSSGGNFGHRLIADGLPQVNGHPGGRLSLGGGRWIHLGPFSTAASPIARWLGGIWSGTPRHGTTVGAGMTRMSQYGDACRVGVVILRQADTYVISLRDDELTGVTM